MQTTNNIAARLTTIGNNIIGNSALKNICIEAADRLLLQHNALGELVEDSQNAGHHCKDEYCPVMQARQVYCLGAE